MTPEQRLDRAERIVILMAKAGYRARREMRQYASEHAQQMREHAQQMREHAVRMREQDEKIHMLIQAQMETTEQIKALAAGQARLDKKISSPKRKNGKSD